MGLNTIRLEGKLETDEFYDLADREGILIMPGWCCCDQWEMWDKWDARGPPRRRRRRCSDQILRLRNHPSVLAWLNGSDFPPAADGREGVPRRAREAGVAASPCVSNATDAPRAAERPDRA